MCDVRVSGETKYMALIVLHLLSHESSTFGRSTDDRAGYTVQRGATYNTVFSIRGDVAGCVRA